MSVARQPYDRDLIGPWHPSLTGRGSGQELDASSGPEFGSNGHYLLGMPDPSATVPDIDP